MNDPQSPGPTAASAVGTPPPDTSPVAVPVNSEGQTDYSMSGSLVQADIDTTVGIVGATTPTPASVGVARSLSPVKKHSKKKLGIVLAAVVIGLGGLFGGGAYAYTTYQKTENVLPQAIGAVLSATQLRAKTTVTSDFSYDQDGVKISSPKLVFEAGAERTPRMDNDAQLGFRYNDKDITLKASVLVTSDGTVYYKVENVKDTLKKVLGNDVSLSAKAESIIDTIDGKWAKYTIADISETSAKSGKTAQCVLDTYKKYKDDKKVSSELAEVYKQHQFLVPNGEPTKKDDNTGYPVKFDQQIYNQFEKAADKTTVSRELRDCRGISNTENNSETTSEPHEPSKDDPTVEIVVWVTAFSHKLRGIDTKVTYPSGPNDVPFSIVSQTEIIEGKGVTTPVPTTAMTSKEWFGQAGDFYNEMTGQELPRGHSESEELGRIQASLVRSKAYYYAANNRGSYPESAAIFTQGEYSTVSGDSQASFRVADTLPSGEGEVGYQRCSITSAQVIYHADSNTYKAIGLGDAPSGVVTKFC